MLPTQFWIVNYYVKSLQARRKRGGRGACAPPHFLADQLTLSQPGGAHYPHPLLLAPGGALALTVFGRSVNPI